MNRNALKKKFEIKCSVLTGNYFKTLGHLILRTEFPLKKLLNRDTERGRLSRNL